MRRALPFALALAAPVVAALMAAAPARAAEPAVVAVVACDPYADLKKQLRWVGTLVDQPALDGLAEGPLMMATQFKGLAGLDVDRPIGLVVTAGDDLPAVHAYVPVKNLGKLLDALQGLTGPVEEADGVKRISPPGGMPLDIVEKNGWAIIGQQGSAPPVADPGDLFAGVVKQFTLGVQAFPSRMPESMREQFLAMLRQAAAAQGPAIDPAVLGAAVDREIEWLILGLAIDMDRERVYLETQSRATAESPAAAQITDFAKGVTTVATPATADGKPPAISLHLAAAVPESLRQAAIEGLAAMQADDDAKTAVGILRESLAAMIEAGGYDAAMVFDTSPVKDDASKAQFTGGMRVKDGRGLEARIKKLVAEAGETPGLKVEFDAGEAAGAKLHKLTLQAGNGVTGDKDVDVTLAVAPNYAWVLAGGDVPARLAAVAKASGQADADVKPVADVNVALGPLLRYVAAVARAQGDVPADPEGLEAAADVADAEKSALVQLLVRPIQRGMAVRLSADAGAVRTVATSVKRQAGAAGPGAPRTGGPDPVPFAAPVR